MNLLFVGQYDWANICNRVARAINATTEHTARVCTKQHPFGYPEDIVVTQNGAQDALMDAARRADWIISDDGDGYQLLGRMLLDLPLRRNVRMAALHIGTSYRDEHEWFNRADATMAFDRIIVGGDLYRFCKDNPRAVPVFAPPHMEPLAEVGPLPDKIAISHSPSQRGTKGTKEILAALEGLNLDLIEKVSFAECARRRAASQIFVDQWKPEIGGYGASSAEALAVGCVSLASKNNMIRELDKFYPPPPIINIESPAHLRASLETLLADREALQQHRKASLQWAQTHASQKAIANYWIKALT